MTAPVINFEMHRHADVDASTVNVNGNECVRILVNEDVEHIFPSTSRVSKALEVSTIDQIRDRLNGGHFFTAENELVDFRDSQYNGFVHSTENIASLVDTIGISNKSDLAGGRKYATTQGNVVLASEWTKSEIVVPEYNEGGQFDSHLMFQWSPFNQNVNSMFYLKRLICLNGMVGLTNFLNARIPVVNRWSDHLDIAATQIQNKIESKVGTRLSAMGKTPASVQQLQLVADHAAKRAKDDINSDNIEVLERIARVANPRVHLADTYKDRVFDNANLAAQMPAHLSEFDAMNLATEINTHTNSTTGSTNRALDKFASDLVFTPVDNSSRAARFATGTISSTFSNPEQAFYGTVAA
jgi:hypothetical protein